MEMVIQQIYIESSEPHPLTSHPSRDFLSGDLVPIFSMSWMAIVGKAGSDPAAFSFVIFPSGLPAARAVPMRFIPEGEHLAPDAFAL
jgi:hypothetical protein